MILVNRRPVLFTHMAGVQEQRTKLENTGGMKRTAVKMYDIQIIGLDIVYYALSPLPQIHTSKTRG